VRLAPCATAPGATLVSASAHISGAAAGLHLECSAADVVRHAAANGQVADLDSYRVHPGDPALVLGYGNLADSSSPSAVAVLKDALRACRRG
jgi:GntR family transcriptional regulator/MocR family aminotransferase